MRSATLTKSFLYLVACNMFLAFARGNFECGNRIPDLQTTFNIIAVIEQLNEKLDAVSHLVEQQNRQIQEIRETLNDEAKPRDCDDIRAEGHNSSGVYEIYLGNCLWRKRRPISVYCEMNSSGNSLVFQRRMDGSVDFYRTWVEYANGFGNKSGEFWLGNEALYLLTSGERKYKLRVDLEDFEGEKRYAEYSRFSIGPSSDFYRLTATGYSGNAGDSLAYHNGRQFSTKDADHDEWSGNCAISYHGAWWYYGNCHHSNLNGLYQRDNERDGRGLNWWYWNRDFYSFKRTEMKITRFM